MRWNFVAIFFLMLAGCAGAPPPLPAAQQSAAQADARGRDAFQRSDYHEAFAEYQRSLSLNRSTENLDGIATSLLNLSLVYRRLGDNAKAMDVLGQVLAGDGLSFSDAQRTEAAYRKASFSLEDGNVAEARRWTDKAFGHCGGRCSAEGRLYNLMARMSLPERPAEAQEHARRALALNRNASDKNEEANSQRLIADAVFQTNDFKSAQQFYDAALQLDKDSGVPAKLALDLMGLGRSIARQGRRDEAVEYFQRAYSVSEGAGDAKAMEDAAAEMKRLTP